MERRKKRVRGKGRWKKNGVRERETVRGGKEGE